MEELYVAILCKEGLTMPQWNLIEIAIDDLAKHFVQPIPTLFHLSLKPNARLVAFDDTLLDTEATITQHNLPLPMNGLGHL